MKTQWLLTAACALLLAACGGGSQKTCKTFADCDAKQACVAGVCQAGGTGGGTGGGSGGGVGGGTGGGVGGGGGDMDGGTGGGVGGGAGGGVGGGAGGGVGGGAGGGVGGGAGGGVGGGAGGGVGGGAGGGVGGGAGGGVGGGAGGGVGGGAGGGVGGGAGGGGGGVDAGVDGGAGGGGGGVDAGVDGGSGGGGGTDAGTIDAGTDAGNTDSGVADAGGADAGGTDAGGTDAGGTDAGLDGGAGAPGDTCGNAIAIAATTTRNGESTATGYANDYSPAAGATSCTGFANAGFDKVYAITLPAGQRVSATVTPIAPTASADPSIYLLPSLGSCVTAPAACLAGADINVGGGAESLSFINSGAATTVFLVVDTYSSTSQAMSFNLTVTIDTPPPPPTNDSCATAQAITITAGSGSATGDTSSANNSNALTADGGFPASPSCTTSASGTGKDVIYSYTLASTQDVSITVTPTGASLLNPAVYVRNVCTSALLVDERVCSAPFAATATTATIAAQPAGTYFIWVDGTTGTSGAFNLAITTTTPGTPGDVCGNAVPIAATTTKLGESTAVGYANDYAPAAAATNCTGDVNIGFDKVYAVAVPAGMRLSATVTPVAPTASADPSIYVLPSLGSCIAAPTSCLTGADQNAAGGAESITWINSGATTTVYLVVDTYTASPASMTYNLAVTIDALPPPPSNDICATAQAIAIVGGAGSATGDTSSANNSNALNPDGGTPESPSCTTTASATGKDVLFAYTLVSTQNVTITATPTGISTLNPAVYVRGVCTSPLLVDELACTAPFALAPATVTIAGQPAGTYFIWVDGTFDSAGAFSLAIATNAPPAGDTCQAPNALSAGTVLSAQSLAGFGDNYSGAGTNCSSSSGGPDRAYQLTIPANQQATITVTPDAGFDTSVSVVASPASNCVARTCVGNNNGGGAGAPDVVAVSNKSGVSGTYFVVVDSLSTATGLFSVGATLGAIPAGDYCGNAPAPIIASGTVSAQTTTGLANDYGAGTLCTGTAGADRVHAVTVPNGMKLTATVHPTSSWDPSINLVAGPAASCETTPRVCLAGADTGATGQDDTLNYVNSSGSSQTLFLVVDSFSVGITGTYDLVVTIALPGEICGNAVPITPGTLTGETTAAYANNYSPGSGATNCTGFSNTGLDKVYAITIGANKTLTATLTPTNGQDGSMYLLANVAACIPAPLSCLAGVDANANSNPEILTYTNASASAVNVLLVVDSFFTGTMTYNLTTSIP